MIAIIDYGVGNLNAFVNIYKKLSIPIIIAKTKADLEQSEKIILPGVGAFDYAIGKLNQSGMRETLDDMILNKKKPVLGICVGMQILAKSSEEGVLPGLGYIDATVKKLPEHTGVNLPHMGWNDVHPENNIPIFASLEQAPLFYFLHSYYFVCNNREDILATAYYGENFTCAAGSGNIFGVQFHPEKSHSYGIRLLENFSKL